MKKLARAFDFQRFQQNPRLAAITCEAESRYAKAALSDDDLELVSAAGDTTVPTEGVKEPIGQHARPDVSDERSR